MDNYKSSNEKCPLCENEGKTVGQYNDFDLKYCQACQLRFSSPMAEPSEHFYQQCSLYDTRSKDNQAEVNTYNWRYQTFMQLCAKQPGKMLFDIGCGDGRFLSFAQEKGFNVFGLDIDERAVDFAREVRKLRNVTNSRWEEIKKRSGWKDFDIVSLFDILEHVARPTSLINTAFDLLKPGGAICITVPRLDRFPAIFNKEADFPPHHLTLWTSKSLRKLLENAGFNQIYLIEKPLMIEDLVLHLYWRTKQLKIGIINKDPMFGVEEKYSRQEASTIKRAALKRLAKQSILLSTAQINKLINLFKIGKGHTLLAIGRK